MHILDKVVGSRFQVSQFNFSCIATGEQTPDQNHDQQASTLYIQSLSLLNPIIFQSRNSRNSNETIKAL